MRNEEYVGKLADALELIKKNSTPTYYEKSEIKLFNEIGEYATSIGYTVKYFSWARIPLNYYDMEEVELGVMHYIHIFNDENMKVSIYFDNKNMGATMGCPYYELYDCDDIERFFEDEEDELFVKTKKILSEGK